MMPLEAAAFAAQSGGGGSTGPFELVGDILSSTPFAAAVALWDSYWANIRQEEFRQEQLRLAEEARGRLGPANERLLAETERIAGQNLVAGESFFGSAGSRFADVADPLRESIGERTRLGIAGAEDIVNLQRERETRLLDEFGNLGQAERADINQRFGAFGRTQQARLAGLGLGGTTAAAGVASGVLRARGRELGLFEEGLRRERLDLSERLSGETLAAQGASLEFATGLRGEDIQARGDLGFAGLDYGDRAFTNLISERERLGLAGPREELAGVERMNELELNQIINEPPVVGQSSLLGFDLAQRG
jgi:hypothetical protein